MNPGLVTGFSSFPDLGERMKNPVQDYRKAALLLGLAKMK